MNNDITTIKTAVYLIGGLFTIIGILMGIIGYWVKGFISATKTLQSTVTAMNTTLEVQKDRHLNFVENYNKEQDVITKRLNAHAERLDEHSKEIVCLKTKVNV